MVSIFLGLNVLIVMWCIVAPASLLFAGQSPIQQSPPIYHVLVLRIALNSMTQKIYKE